MNERKDGGRARDRQRQRHERREAMVKRMPGPNQIAPANASRREAMQINIPGLRWLIFLPGAIIIFIAVIAVLGLLNPPETQVARDAIWFNASWTHTTRSDDVLIETTQTLRQHGVGMVFAFVSSLNSDNSWSGAPDGSRRFSDVQDNVRTFNQRMRQVYPEALLFAWVEVIAETPEGYRLDSPQVQRTVATFTRQMIEDYGFDGILLDVKPVFNDNEDYLRLMRAIRNETSLSVPLAVAIPADLTPEDAGLNLPEFIAPGTMLSETYKQRIALQADWVIVTAYNSYLDNPVDYIEWVAYQVNAFTLAMNEINTSARLLISIPNYAPRPPAHNPAIESMAGALDGIARGLSQMKEAQRTMFQGIAIFTDRDLTADDWRIVREKGTF